MKKLSLLSIITVFAIIFSLNTIAEDELPSHKVTKISIREKATIEAKPDTFTTTVRFSNEDRSSDEAQREVNKQIKNAINIVKNSQIKYNLGSFSTYQEYKSKDYIASQSISLESKDVEELQKVVSILQGNDGKVTNTNPFMSDELTQRYFEELFKRAYKKAENKAKFITKTLNGKKFVITKIDYYLNNSTPRVYARSMMAKSINADIPEDERINIDNNEQKLNLDLNISVTILPK